MSPTPIKPSCKIRLHGGTITLDAQAHIVFYPYEPSWRAGTTKEPGIQADGTFIPGGPQPLLGGKPFPTGIEFWFGSADLIVDSKKLEEFIGRDVDLLLEDGRSAMARVLKTLNGNDFSMVFFVGITPL